MNPLGHAWGEPVYAWAGDNSSVTARSICGRDQDHVLEETAAATASAAGKGKTVWTAEFENGIFTTQTRSENAGDTADAPDVRAGSLKGSGPVATGDQADPALWYTLLAAALVCMGALSAVRRGSCHTDV